MYLGPLSLAKCFALKVQVQDITLNMLFTILFAGGQIGIQIGSQFSGGLLRKQNGTFIYTVYLYLFAAAILNNKNVFKNPSLAYCQ